MRWDRNPWDTLWYQARTLIPLLHIMWGRKSKKDNQQLKEKGKWCISPGKGERRKSQTNYSPRRVANENDRYLGPGSFFYAHTTDKLYTKHPQQPLLFKHTQPTSPHQRQIRKTPSTPTKPVCTSYISTFCTR